MREILMIDDGETKVRSNGLSKPRLACEQIVRKDACTNRKAN